MEVDTNDTLHKKEKVNGTAYSAFFFLITKSKHFRLSSIFTHPKDLLCMLLHLYAPRSITKIIICAPLIFRAVSPLLSDCTVN